MSERPINVAPDDHMGSASWGEPYIVGSDCNPGCRGCLEQPAEDAELVGLAS